MGLSQALSAAAAGLKVTQSSLSLVAANVANANTPGYVRKTAVQTTTVAGDAGIGVRFDSINRQLDQFTQSQLRTETAGGNYADVKADFYDRLQDVYGQPGSSTALDTVFNNFTTALQALQTSPDSNSAQSGVLNAAQVLAQQLNGMTSDIQGLRTNAEQGLSTAVDQANTAMQQIAKINQQLASSNTQDASAVSLEDQRDSYIDQLSTLMDIKVTNGDNNQVNIFTSSGTQLVGSVASTLSFDAKGSLTADSQWSADPSKRSVGTISLVTPNGQTTDLIQSGAFRSGQIAAYVEMRDQVLPQAQAQLDQIASAMSKALSDQTTNGTAVSAPPRSGFDVDIGSLQPGNSINLTYTDNATGKQRNVTIVNVDDSKALPLPASTTADPNDVVIGVKLSNGLSSAIAQINNALGGAGLQFSNPSGTTLRVLDDGSANRIDVNSLSATATMTSLTSGSTQLPMFTDGFSPFTGAITSDGSETTGFAGRIAVNPALLADPTKLVAYQGSTATGDPTRPNFILNQLNSAITNFAPQAGIGTTASPFSGSLESYIQQMTSQQAAAASAADNLKQGQDVVVNTLQQKFADGSGVNIDQEMTNLLNLQMAYSANARVMTTVRDMLDTLLKS